MFRRAFTLVELLIVISVMGMLMVVLLPAVLRVQAVVRGIIVRGQITSLANACNQYFTTFNGQYPGVLPDPPDAGGGRKLSGCQSLRLSLMGCSRTGGVYVGEYRGPADFIDRYGQPGVPKHPALYNPRPAELVRHRNVFSVGDDSAYDGDIEVFVDYRLRPARPLLYFRQRAGHAVGGPFELDDNSIYLTGADGGGREFDARYNARGPKDSPGFLILSAGPDRAYRDGGGDDKDNLGN